MDDQATTLLAIAQKHFGIETLKERKRDSLDFHDIHVGQIKAALEAAYQAGIEAGAKR